METAYFKNEFSLRDKKFNLASVAYYHLTIHVGLGRLKLCCSHYTKEKCLFLEVYRVQNNATACSYIQGLEQVYTLHPFLKENAWASVTLCIANQQYTLIPPHFFQEADRADYMRLVCPLSELDQVVCFTHSQLYVTVVFSLETLLLNWFQSIYSQVSSKIIHQASSLIEGAVLYTAHNAKRDRSKVFVWLEENTYMHVVVIQKKKLIFYNKFRYQEVDAVLNYLLAVISTLSLGERLYDVVIGGTTVQDYLLYKKARKYILNITLSESIFFFSQYCGLFGMKKALPMCYFDVAGTFLCQ